MSENQDSANSPEQANLARRDFMKLAGALAGAAGLARGGRRATRFAWP